MILDMFLTTVFHYCLLSLILARINVTTPYHTQYLSKATHCKTQVNVTEKLIANIPIEYYVM